ncbi:hypothetical protein Cgig2_022028 [Carnegiea gigantea]|uniref:BHLH domain-containing protein n=1 Tax=Carnegiea gigantea TaxID=171969 RepID=A0A9Q1KRB9_9CARY|nr:hypothetical protein Cgig2_022028 [Carnegiea gigantea]
MALEAILSYSDLLNFMVYETPNVLWNRSTMGNSYVMVSPQCMNLGSTTCSPVLPPVHLTAWGTPNCIASLAVQGRKKRKRKPKVCRNKEEGMTHIAVERNRRKLMNDRLAVLRSLMPDSYAQKGDQASIVGGAIEFVREPEHVVQSLQVKKLLLLQQGEILGSDPNVDSTTNLNSKDSAPQVAEFSTDGHQYPASQVCNKYTLKSKAGTADIEVTFIKTHVNLHILSKKTLRQLSKMVSGFETFDFTMLHFNVTSLDPSVLYYTSAKVSVCYFC